MLDSDIIDLYISGKTTYEVAKICDCSQSFVCKRLKHNNIARRPTSFYNTKYVANINFFDKIDSQEKAYFLGLMFSDGNNYSNNHSYEISIKLIGTDYAILEKFRDLLSPTTKLKIDKYCLFKINSKIISEQLTKLGCVPNKSLILDFPKIDFINHFIRGYFDGDGSIWAKVLKNGHVDYGVSFTSSNIFCRKLKDLLEENLKIHFTSKLACPRTNQITTTIQVGGNRQVKKLLDYIYKDANVYLDRKYQKYKEANLCFDRKHQSYFSSSSSSSSSGTASRSCSD